MLAVGLFGDSLLGEQVSRLPTLEGHGLRPRQEDTPITSMVAVTQPWSTEHLPPQACCWVQAVSRTRTAACPPGTPVSAREQDRRCGARPEGRHVGLVLGRWEHVCVGRVGCQVSWGFSEEGMFEQRLTGE